MDYLRNFQTMRDLYLTLTKAGNTNTTNTNVYSLNITLHKACPEKETVWTTA